jgi:hypothetical protein
MRTVRRRRDSSRQSRLSVVVVVRDDEAPEPGDVVMLDGLGACLVLSVAAADGSTFQPLPQERAVALEVEAFATDNTAPDVG